MTTGAPPALIRPLCAEDRDQWTALWRDYLAFYNTTLPDSTYDIYFGRLLGNDRRDFRGFVAVQGETLIGLTHFVFHPHGWKVEDTCYLQDLFVAPAARGTGAARALIEAVYAAADAAGAPSVYWMTQEDNAAGRRLYDRIGTLTNFIKYQRPT